MKYHLQKCQDKLNTERLGLQTKDREHILSMPWVSGSPGFICHRVNLSRAMVPLVKRDSYKARSFLAVFPMLQPAVPIVYSGAGYGRHTFLCLESRIQKP